MNDNLFFIDLHFVAFHGVQKVVTNSCKWLSAFVAEKRESIQKYKRGTEVTFLELPAAN